MVNDAQRIETALEAALNEACRRPAPPRLAAAVRHAVLPGGARVRPRLVLAVAAACGDDDPALSTAAAVAIELLHCASLVHDDLPCFDAAALRRGRPSVHCAYGERLAVLTGDSLIVIAMQALAQGASRHPLRLPSLLSTVCAGVAPPDGIAAGQALECEPQLELSSYQQAKTGALFAAATMAGALAAGAPAGPWRRLGERLGQAYQAADDIRDVVGDEALLGKPAHQDERLSRPSLARELGVAAASAEFRRLINDTLAAVPVCAGAPALRELIRRQAERLIPSERFSVDRSTASQVAA